MDVRIQSLKWNRTFLLFLADREKYICMQTLHVFVLHWRCCRVKYLMKPAQDDLQVWGIFRRPRLMRISFHMKLLFKYWNYGKQIPACQIQEECKHRQFTIYCTKGLNKMYESSHSSKVILRKWLENTLTIHWIYKLIINYQYR